MSSSVSALTLKKSLLFSFTTYVTKFDEEVQSSNCWKMFGCLFGNVTHQMFSVHATLETQQSPVSFDLLFEENSVREIT